MDLFIQIKQKDGEKGEPIIYHGFTLTSRISFEDVIKTINDYGFENNLYPIILSIENHCKSKQQERMAEILIKILGDKLYKLPEDYQKYEYYPSPNQLKKKVIIKDKGKLPNFEQKMLEMIDTDLNMLDFDEEVVYMDQKSKNLLNWEEMKLITTVFEKYDLNLRYTLRPKTNFPSSQSKEKSFVSNLPLDENMKKSNKEMVNSLQNIEEKKLDSKQNIIILKKKEEEHHLSNVLHSMEIHKSKLNISNQESGVSKKKEEKEKNPIFQKILGMFGIKMNLDDSRSIWNISSINEEKISKFLKDREIEIIDFHRKYFTRIYPSGKRVDSSNYDPIDSFNVGAQIIALNVQTADIPLLIYFSKFVENGGSNCGYVLKPAFLLHDATKIKYINDFNNLKKILHIKVISGQQLRPEDEKDVRDVADPYVEVSLRGCFKDEAENHKTFKSIIVKNNGFNPIFNLEATFKIFCPELCLIIFKTFDQEGGLKKDMRLGWYSIPFHCIREGYRIVPLLNSHLKPIEFSYLFCHISIEDIK